MARPGTSDSYRPSTRSYDYNYGYGVNYYQPMIDYLDAKEGGRRAQYPHLPWTNERGLDQYSPTKLVRSYSQEDLNKMAQRTERRAKDYLSDYKSKTQSAFLLHKSASAASITTQVKSEVRKQHDTVRKIKVLKSKMADDLSNYDPDLDKKVEYSLKSAKKFLRGKSARAIETLLLSESNKNIAQAKDVATSKIVHSASSQSLHHDARVHSKLVCSRMERDLDDSFTQPLDNLSEELKGFSKKTTRYYVEKR